jgi:cell division protein FtsI (penicillin-binding protein 3)
MRKRQFLARRRLRFALVIALFGFVLFGARLVQIQAFDTSAYAARATNAGTAQVIDPAQRGQIVDRNGVELAGSADTLTLTADPTMTDAHAPQLARILMQSLDIEVDYFELIDKLRTPHTHFVYLIKNLPAYKARAALDAIAKANVQRPADAKLVGVFSQRSRTRTYPGGSLAANLLGFVNDQGDGVGGIEQQYDRVLHGKEGKSTYEVSPTGQRIPLADVSITKMVPGSSIRTTIDRDLQWYADQRLADAVHSSGADWGLALTMDTQTCELVQMSQVPTFNADAKQRINDFTTVARSFQTVYEPGSVMKTVTFAALVDRGKVQPDTPIVVPGSITVDGFKIGDYWPHGTLHLTAAGVLAKSSNMGTVVASKQLSDDQLYGYFRKFGFGQMSGVDLPGESRGILHQTDDWTASSHATMSFGQGVSVTAVQMLRAVNAIANDGVMCDPNVVTSVTDPGGTKTEVRQAHGHRVISSSAARTVTRMMEGVTAPDGTAPAAAIEGYRVAGKTGTAWRVDPLTHRYSRGLNTVSFIGFAPADRPRFITYVVLDRVGGNAGGGVTAAPVFNGIMRMALERFGIPPTGSRSPVLAQAW